MIPGNHYCMQTPLGVNILPILLVAALHTGETCFPKLDLPVLFDHPSRDDKQFCYLFGSPDL